MSALHLSEGLPGKEQKPEAPQRHGREVRARTVNDRIVSDKTFWNATVSRSFFQEFFPELHLPKWEIPVNSSKQTQYRFNAETACEGLALTVSDSRRTRRIHFFS
jgi:hypothetical protein